MSRSELTTGGTPTLSEVQHELRVYVDTHGTYGLQPNALRIIGQWSDNTIGRMSATCALGCCVRLGATGGLFDWYSLADTATVHQFIHGIATS